MTDEEKRAQRYRIDLGIRPRCAECAKDGGGDYVYELRPLGWTCQRHREWFLDERDLLPEAGHTANAGARRRVSQFEPGAFETRGVLAGQYRGRDVSDRPLLTHTAWPDSDDAICGTIQSGGLADVYSDQEGSQLPPTCPRCLAKDPRFDGGAKAHTPNEDQTWREVYAQGYREAEARGLQEWQAREEASRSAWADYEARTGRKPYARNPGARVVTDVLGRVREAQEYPDGSYNCPFCTAAVLAGTPAHEAGACPSPGCYARGGAGMPAYPVERAQQEVAAAERRQQEQEARARQVQHSAAYAAESRRREREQLDSIQAEARARGACPACALDSARWGRAPKYTKHRGACPKQGPRHATPNPPLWESDDEAEYMRLLDTYDQEMEAALAQEDAGYSARASIHRRAAEAAEAAADRISRRYAANGQGYYVWALAVGSDEPLAEGPWGPYDSLDSAKTFARIGATEGAHDRAVSLGLDAQAAGFQIVRRYQARSGERLL